MKTARTAKHSKIELKDKNMAKILSKSWQQRKEKVSKYSMILLLNILIFRKDKKENITEKCLNLNNS